MKKIWKALGVVALAAMVPVRFKKDEETGRKSFQSLLATVNMVPSRDENHKKVSINLGEGVLTDAISGLMGRKKEDILYADDFEDVDFEDDVPRETLFEVGMKVERELPVEVERAETVPPEPPEAEPVEETEPQKDSAAE